MLLWLLFLLLLFYKLLNYNNYILLLIILLLFLVLSSSYYFIVYIKQSNIFVIFHASIPIWFIFFIILFNIASFYYDVNISGNKYPIFLRVYASIPHTIYILTFSFYIWVYNSYIYLFLHFIFTSILSILLLLI